MEVLDKYILELGVDLMIDRVSLDEKVLLVAGIKGKWLSKMVKHKRELAKYQELLENAKAKLIEDYNKTSDISYSKATLDKMIMDHDVCKKIKKQMDDERLAIEFCDKSLNIVSSMSYDIKNIIDWSKLELT